MFFIVLFITVVVGFQGVWHHLQPFFNLKIKLTFFRSNFTYDSCLKAPISVDCLIEGNFSSDVVIYIIYYIISIMKILAFLKINL
jgi:hypothetical protein